MEKSRGQLLRLKERTRKIKNRGERMAKERAKTGFEVEFLIIDGEGDVSNESDKILSHIEKRELKHEAVKECCHSFIEMGVYPRIYVRNVATKFFEDMLGVLDVAEKYDLAFYPMGMYPYKYEPEMRRGGWYGVKEKIFGEKWGYAGRCAGFHLHYSLPQGIFRYEDRHLEENAMESEKRKTVNSYNFATAIDPAVTAFTQSSPIFEGKFLAKDSRLLLYRGGDVLKYDGLYSDHQLFGALLPYISEYEDLIELAETRYEKWVETVKGAGGDVKGLEGKNKLDFAWNPVKINKVGSIELRNMDMNMPSVLMAVSVLVKYALRDIQREKIEIVPTKEAVADPFRFEDDRILIPPFEHLSKKLQYHAAWDGLEDDTLYDYCKKFFSLCIKFVNKKYYPILKPVKDMLKRRETRSDEILRVVKKKGHDYNEDIPEEVLREVVLHYSKMLRRDISRTEELMNSLTEEDRVWL